VSLWDIAHFDIIAIHQKKIRFYLQNKDNNECRVCILPSDRKQRRKAAQTSSDSNKVQRTNNGKPIYFHSPRGLQTSELFQEQEEILHPL
jgi:hypothetical protein